MTVGLCTLLLAAAGCSAATQDAGNLAESAPPKNSEQGSWISDYDYDGMERAQQDGQSQVKPRYVIREGHLTLTVLDTYETVEKIEQMTASSGGIISESNVFQFREGQYAAELTLRIPEMEFDSFIGRLQDLGEAADVQKNSEDVTLPYLDMETRIKNLKAEEERLREILAQAGNVEEILQVERELFRVRGEIEAMTTEFTHLQDLVALSTIRLAIREEVIGAQNISQKPFENMGKRLKEALFRSINFVSSAAAFVIVALTTLLPALIIIGLPVILVIRLIRLLRQKRGGHPPGGQPPMAR